MSNFVRACFPQEFYKRAGKQRRDQFIGLVRIEIGREVTRRRSSSAVVAAIAIPTLFAIGTSLPAYAATNVATQTSGISLSAVTPNENVDPGDEDCTEDNVGDLYQDEDGGYWWECTKTSYGYAWRMILSCPGPEGSTVVARLSSASAAC